MESDVATLTRAVDGELVYGNASAHFKGVGIDSRTLEPGQLFVCIQGDRFDGHQFAQQVLDNKASGVVVSRRESIPMETLKKHNAFAVLVPDTLRALQDLAACQRNRLPVRVVGITGTNGKSTTKEMIAGIAGVRFQTLKTQGNLNNHIGLPLSLLELDASHEVAVLEMGMSAAGEIRRLAEIARPDIGVITNISEAHMVHLKTLKQVQAVKGELYEALSVEGTAIVNADDPLVRDLAKGLRARTITYGIDHPADVQASDISPRKPIGFDFTVTLFDQKIAMQLPMLGYYNIYNALAAVATGHSLGIPSDAMNAGLAEFQMMSQRSEVLHHKSMTLINDAYNANPQSMRQALDTLQRFQVAGRKFFVAGDMWELGSLEEEAHLRLGEAVAQQGLDYFVTVGPRARLAAESSIKNGMPANRVAALDDHQEAVDYLMHHAKSGDCLLFKGSRGAQMEKVIEGLMQ
ncbi:MAG: UDP-N-acetylmuramoyl-tripeptide--D-alanyl-D-alanine ligase [Nitrospina sp.]|nr:MAG: UDP-N-acetylmuramoyl-tripeptide--D-alanyl-D-alanine ligase [Nitrospina sp.]